MFNSQQIIDQLTFQVLAGNKLSFSQGEQLMALPSEATFSLLQAAHCIREKFTGKEVEFCAISAGKVGHCTENCAFCAQSIFNHTHITEHAQLNPKEILDNALKMEQKGVHRFSLVNSGYGPLKEEFAAILDLLSKIKTHTQMKLCASLGIISEEMAINLKQVGISRYHHNLESSASYYPQICTTHTYEERIQTIETVKKVGLEICSGGIISMGETAQQRLELAFALQKLDVDSIPINILHPIPGTPLAQQKILPPLELLKIIAIFRFVLPDKQIRLAGGRMTNLRDLQSFAFYGGINATITGDFLTTTGRCVEDDWQLVNDLTPIFNCD